MSAHLLDTDTASRLLRGDRATVAAMRRSGATEISISVITQAELLYGARLRPATTSLMSAVRDFLGRVTVHIWDEDAAEHHAEIRVAAKASGRSAGAFDLMIAAHARSLGATLVTSDKAIANLGIAGLALESWQDRRK